MKGHRLIGVANCKVRARIHRRGRVIIAPRRLFGSSASTKDGVETVVPEVNRRHRIYIIAAAGDRLLRRCRRAKH